MIKLTVLPAQIVICKFPAHSQFPFLEIGGGFLSCTRTQDEISVVCEEDYIHPGLLGMLKIEKGWRALKANGPLDFSLTGILSTIATPLATAKISIFAISTFDTDYVLIQNEKLESAVQVLRDSGFEFF